VKRKLHKDSLTVRITRSQIPTSVSSNSLSLIGDLDEEGLEHSENENPQSWHRDNNVMNIETPDLSGISDNNDDCRAGLLGLPAAHRK
jgi:hypothetical protein